VYKLAKELGVKSALILELLDLLGKEVKSDLSTIDEKTAGLVRRRLLAAIEEEKKRLEEEKAAEPEPAPSPEPEPEPEELEHAEVEETAPAAGEPVAEPVDGEAAEAPAEEVVEETAVADEPDAVEETVEAAREEAPTDEEPEAAAAETPEVTTEAPKEPEPAVDKPAVAVERPTLAASPSTKTSELKKRRPPEPPPKTSVDAPSLTAAPRTTRASAVPPPPGAARPKRVFEAKVIPSKAELRARLQRTTRPGARPVRPGGPGGPGGPAGPAGPGVGPGGLGGPGSGPGPGGPKPGKRKKKKGRKEKAERGQTPVPVTAKPKDLPPVPESITLSEAVTVKELAEKLNRKSKDVIAKLITRGVLATINQPLDPEMAIDVAKEFGSDATVLTFEEEAQRAGTGSSAPSTPAVEDEGIAVEEGAAEDRVIRPPVVTVMGHVDHGKTSLLDALRETDVVSGESGGITQHIGAYQTSINDRKITFLDTPGHEAFTLMRARGARVTDIVVLVVAADDGVKPQTMEAIDHAREAGVPMVVAINKIDKPGANVDRVKQQLADREVLVEDYGGDVVACEVSAKKKTGLDQLLEMILLVADMQEFKADPNIPGHGVVLEAKLDRSRGVIASVLVQTGTLRRGDPFIAGTAPGKVRAMTNEFGEQVDEAGPSSPVEVMGFASEPTAGDTFQVVANEAKARQIAQIRSDKIKERERASSRGRHATLESLARDIQDGQVKELAILLKADVQGSIEAIRGALSDLPADKIRIRIIRSSIGAITQADVLLASASDAIVVGFNVRPDRAAQDAAKEEDIEIRLYTVIYDLLDEVKQVMIGKLEPTIKETVLGQAEVRATFKVPKIGVIAGSYVTDGKVTRNAEVRLIRDNVLIYTGKVGSLKRFKDDVGEVKSGYECGIGIAGYNDVKEGDVIEFFVKEAVAAESL
jgi:translation initiation factor IF-2